MIMVSAACHERARKVRAASTTGRALSEGKALPPVLEMRPSVMGGEECWTDKQEAGTAIGL